MGSLHSIHPENHLSVTEQNEVFQDFSGIVLEDYIISHGIEIQSRRTLRNGRERRYSPRYFHDVWDAHLRRFLSDPSIDLPGMLKNYHDKKSTHEQKRAIYMKLKEAGMRGLTMEDELEREALMLGIAMMLGDDLDISTSLLYAFEYGNDIATILDKSEEIRSEKSA